MKEESAVRYNPPLLAAFEEMNLHSSKDREVSVRPALESVISKIPPASEEEAVRVSDVKEREEREATPDVILMMDVERDGVDEGVKVMDERDVVP